MVKTFSDFLGIIFVYSVYLYLTLILIKGVFMIMYKFIPEDKMGVIFHHHYHYRDQRKK